MAMTLGGSLQGRSLYRSGAGKVASRRFCAVSTSTRRSNVRRVRASAETLESPLSEPSEQTGYRKQCQTSMGQLMIQSVQQSDVPGASLLLTRAFAGTPEAIALADATKYIEGMLDTVPRGMFLVARLVPDDPTLLAPGRTSRLVGTAAVSLHPDTMLPCSSLTPPEDGGYLSNMAVDPKLRRIGIARSLLSAADDVARQCAPHLDSIYLHVCAADEAPVKLYSTSGYVEIAKDGPLVQLTLGMRPRLLMRKVLN